MGELTPGTVFAGHQIEAEAGRGGMGVVYRARHLALDVTVALKLIKPELAGDAGFRERFQRESRLAASIEHPNVLSIRDAGEEDGLLYITMRYVEGTDLRSLIDARGRLDPATAVDVLGQVAAALDAAHARGLVHRDVKPANVLIEELPGGRHAYLTDFGLTRHATSEGGLTKTGHWVGTLDYVAPEQIEGQPVDARADVYALGCVLYEMLTGAVPFLKESEVATMYAHLNDDPPRPSERAPGLPPGLDEVVVRAMAKRPDDRYPSAGDLAHAAGAALGGTEVSRPEQSVAVGPAAPGPAPETKAAAVPETRAGARPATAPAARPPRRKRLDGRLRSRWARVGAGAIGVAIVAAVALLVAGVFGGSGPSASAKREAYIRNTLVPGFQTAFAAENLDGIKAFLAPGATYQYPGFDQTTPAEEYASAFKTLDVGNYRLTLDSLQMNDVSDADAQAGAVVGTATLSYRYTHSSDVNSGRVEMDFTTPGGGDPRISAVRALPDIYVYFDVPKSAAPADLDVVARVGRFGNPIAEEKTMLRGGRHIPVALHVSDYSGFDEGTDVYYAATGRDGGGRLNITGRVGYPYAD